MIIHNLDQKRSFDRIFDLNGNEKQNTMTLTLCVAKTYFSKIHTCVKCGDDPRNPKDMILSPANSDRRSRFSVSIIHSVGLLLGDFSSLVQLYHFIFDLKSEMF